VTLHLANITFDCDDALTVGRFWSAVLDRPLDPEPSEHFSSIGLGDTADTSWLFAQVPEPKTAKNRCHVDLAVGDDDPESEIARLVDLGAKRVADKDEWGHSWAVLQDPEGNEFCVSRIAG
jgi:Glyoxalase-like domain